MTSTHLSMSYSQLVFKMVYVDCECYFALIPDRNCKMNYSHFENKKSVTFLSMKQESNLISPLSPRSHHNNYDDSKLGIFSDLNQVSIFLEKM